MEPTSSDGQHPGGFVDSPRKSRSIRLRFGRSARYQHLRVVGVEARRPCQRQCTNRRPSSRVGAEADGGGATAPEFVERCAEQCLCKALVSVVATNRQLLRPALVLVGDAERDTHDLLIGDGHKSKCSVEVGATRHAGSPLLERRRLACRPFVERILDHTVNLFLFLVGVKRSNDNTAGEWRVVDRDVIGEAQHPRRVPWRVSVAKDSEIASVLVSTTVCPTESPDRSWPVPPPGARSIPRSPLRCRARASGCTVASARQPGTSALATMRLSSKTNRTSTAGSKSGDGPLTFDILGRWAARRHQTPRRHGEALPRWGCRCTKRRERSGRRGR